ncbi:hypothetical protein [Alteromonas halophila]|uniref:Uncharacterized protein n=1 Tax=Alteromonas halophila TaxID=516698 RepID=A0A918JNM0_9ALTE|nr:hypothetical protein [Alteromonas halophila]GGW91508.1 hypothetical protein GCM10007391_27360 [Alteromonas halophila]
MRKWLVPITGNHQVLYNLNNWLESPDFCIYEDSEDHLGDAYFLESVHLNGATDINQVISKLKGLLELINGAVAIHWGFDNARSNHQLSFDELYFTDEDFPRESDYSLATPRPRIHEVPPSSPFSVKIPLESQLNSCKDLISARVRMAENSDAVRYLLRQAASGFDWRNLYAIWDTVCYYCGGEKAAVKNLKVDANKKSAFTGTANSFSVLGPEARHGEKGWKVPNNLMTLVEANDFIHELTVTFLKKYHCVKCHEQNLVEKIRLKNELV